MKLIAKGIVAVEREICFDMMKLAEDPAWDSEAGTGRAFFVHRAQPRQATTIDLARN